MKRVLSLSGFRNANGYRWSSVGFPLFYRHVGLHIINPGKMIQNILSLLFAAFIITGCQKDEILPLKVGVGKADITPLFKAGAAASKTTPPLGGGIIGGWNVPKATFIHDELHARCLVLDDGETRLALVVVDILGMSQDLTEEAKRVINQETGLPESNVIISGTHTHSAISALDKKPFSGYQRFLIRRIADGVREAVNNLEPARIGWGAGSVPQHVFVRRWIMKPDTPVPNPFGGQDKVKMNPGYSANLLEPAGKPDPGVSFISVQSLDGRPIALFANYSLHYVGGVPTGHISADYFAVFADRIQELFNANRKNPPFVGIMSSLALASATVAYRQNPPFVGIMSNGTSGDVNNNNYADPTPTWYMPYEKMRIVANDVATEIIRVCKTIQYHDWVPLKAASGTLRLTVRKPDQKMIERANLVLSKPDSETATNVHEKVYAQRSLNLLKWPDQIDVELQTFSIGDLGIATSPFETFAETGMELKEKSPFQPSFNISLANGYYGYLPTQEQHAMGGYETWMGTNNVEIEASRKMVARLLELYNKLK